MPVLPDGYRAAQGRKIFLLRENFARVKFLAPLLRNQHAIEAVLVGTKPARNFNAPLDTAPAGLSKHACKNFLSPTRNFSLLVVGHGVSGVEPLLFAQVTLLKYIYAVLPA